MENSRMDTILFEVRQALHDLAQPLTALQCRLFLADMAGDDTVELQRAVQDALVECERMMKRSRQLAERLEQLSPVRAAESTLGRAA